MGRPREHDETIAEALLDAAEGLLAQGGPEAVSVRGAADGAGTTTRAVYSLFGSKAGLVKGLAARGYRLLAELVGALPETGDPAADLVAAGTEGFRRFAIERPHLFRITFERMPAFITVDGTVHDSLLAAYGALARWVRRAQDAGVVDKRPVPEIAFIFHATCQGLATNELAREPAPVGVGMWANTNDIAAIDIWRHGLDALVRGMGPAPKRSTRRSR